LFSNLRIATKPRPISCEAPTIIDEIPESRRNAKKNLNSWLGKLSIASAIKVLPLDWFHIEISFGIRTTIK